MIIELHLSFVGEFDFYYIPIICLIVLTQHNKGEKQFAIISTLENNETTHHSLSLEANSYMLVKNITAYVKFQ